MKRRSFIKYSLAGSAAGILTPKLAFAIGPLIALRFLFSRAAVRTIGRGTPRSYVAATTRTRASQLQLLRSYQSPRKMYATSPLIAAGVELGGITAISPELFRLVVNFNATTIWINDDSASNEFFITGKNNADTEIVAPLLVSYKELGVTGKPTQRFNHGLLTVNPYEEFSIQLAPPEQLSGFRIINLHGELHGVSTEKVAFEHSDPVVIASPWEVAV